MTRARWLVTKIYKHYTFAQSKSKKNFVIMNQDTRQKAIFSVEKNFYKLLNNANFGIECSSNIDNCDFGPIYNEIGEVGYVKKCDSIFDNIKYSDFSNINIMKEEIEEKYSKLILALDLEDLTFEAKKYSLKNRKEQVLDVVNSINKHRKKIGKKITYNNIKDKIKNVLKSKTTKMLIDFSVEESASLKSFVIKKTIRQK